MSIHLQFQCLRFIKLVDLDFGKKEGNEKPNIYRAESAAERALEYLTEFESQKHPLPLRVKTYEQMTLALQKIANAIKSLKMFPSDFEIQSKVIHALQKAETLRGKARAEEIQQRLPLFLKWLALPIRWAVDKIRKIEPIQVADNFLRHLVIDKIYTHKNRLSALNYCLERIQKDISFREYPGEQVEDLFRRALLYRDIALADPLVQKIGVNTPLKEGQTFLHLAVEANRVDFVQWLLKLQADPSIKNGKGRTAFEIAKDSQRMTLCRILRGPAFFQEAALAIRQKFASCPSDLDHYLIHCFLNSEPDDVASLVNALKKYEEFMEPISHAEAFIKTGGTLVIRFTSQADQKIMFELFGAKKGYRNYEDQQYNFGMQRFQIYSKVLKGILQQNWSLEDVYSHLAVSRPDVTLIPNTVSMLESEHFTVFRTDNCVHHARTLFDSTRYEPYKHLSKQIFAKHLQQLKEDPDSCDPQIRINNEDDFHLVFICENGQEILLTLNDPFGLRPIEFCKPKWNHTLAENAVKLRPILSRLFEEIKAYTKNKVPFNELKKKIAFFYWLACHALIICRGNSQYSLETQKLSFAINGYSITPRSHKFDLPDCVALCMPFGEFYEKYYDDLFEISPLSGTF